MAARKRSEEPICVEPVAELAAERVRASGGCAIAKLGLPKAIRPKVLAVLRDRGLEVTRSRVRLPVTEQLRAALASGACLALRSLKAHGVTGSAAEVRAAVAALVRAGDASLVLRGGALALVSSETDVVSAEELATLARSLDRALKQVRQASKARAKLLRAELSQQLRPLLGAGAAPDAVATAGGGVADGRDATFADAAAAKIARRSSYLPRPLDPSLVERVRDAVEAATDPRTGRAFVPTVVRSLSARADPPAVIEAMRAAAKRGLIELRPDTGLGHLLCDELALCVAGPGGSWLSWARLARSTMS